MYKYSSSINDILLRILYYLLAIRIKEYSDQSYTRLYAKINWWHPIIILTTICLLVGAIIKDIIQIIREDLVEFFQTNHDNKDKGLYIGFYKKDHGKENKSK